MARIMIVDDDITILTMLCEIVEDFGHEVVPCSSTFQAWRHLCTGHEVDLIITDVVMPEMDGREFVAWVLGDSKLKSIPIIVTSGIVTVKNVAKLLEMGDVAFIGKPIRLLALKSTMDRLLNESRVHVATNEENGEI